MKPPHRFEELAAILATPEGLRTVRLLQAAGLLAAPPPAPAAPAPPRRPEPISIWVPQETNDGQRAWVRPDPLPLGDHYATRKTLKPKTAELPLRVAFFGESVAAGYLYAPHLTPAQVLERQLRAAIGRDDFEVIDLARTNETLPSLAATVRASLQIQPDILVLFVGNNWNLLETPEISPYAPSVRARQRFGEALQAEGLDGPLRQAREDLRQVAEGTFELIALLTRTIGIPVVLVLPEVNLADWETRQPVVRLPGVPSGGVARWHELYQSVLGYVEFGEGEDPEGAIESVEEMLELDGGRCPTTWRLLGLIRQELDDPEGVREAFLAEVDRSAYPTLAFLSAPQATSLTRELLRDAARRHGFFAVDLREVFAQHTGSPLPGRRLFLDYCHLTREGIQVAMAAVAAQVLRLSGMTETDETWQSLLSRLPAPEISPEAEATARLGAAIHSAHRLLMSGPKAEMLDLWLDSALDASPGVESAMLDLLEARCAPVPAVLTAAQQRNLASPYRLLLQHGWRWDHLDADLIEAIARVLERRGRPVPLARMLLEHHGIRPEGTELADPFYLWEPLERFYPEVMDLEDLPQRGTLRFPWPEATFCLIVDGTSDVDLELTARLPETDSGEIGVFVNMHTVTLPAGKSWTRATVRIPAAALEPGLNRLTLRFPSPILPADPFQPVIDRLKLGLSADLHPVFGEVASLRAGSICNE